MQELFDAIVVAGDASRRRSAFLRDLCTLAELEAMAHRWQVAQLLERGAAVPGDRAADARVDDDGDAGRALAAPRRGRLPARRSTDASAPEDRRPGQGAPARAVVHAPRGRRARPGAAGRPRARLPVPQRAGRGAARARRRRARSTCRTASSTAGSPASTSCASAAPTCSELLRARVRRVPARGRGAGGVDVRRRSRSSPARRSRRVYPRLARELLPVEVELVDVTGSVEIAPRLGLADAIVDLVSSGNTLRTNGLRSLGDAARVGGGADRRDEERGRAARGDAARASSRRARTAT